MRSFPLPLVDEKIRQPKHIRQGSSSPTRTWPRSSHVKDVLAKKTTAPSALDVISPYNSTTFMLTPPSAYLYNGSSQYHHHYSPSSTNSPTNASTINNSRGKSPSKRFSLQKYYYGRNTMSMSATRISPSRSPSRTPSPPPSLATKPMTTPLPTTHSLSTSLSHLTPASSSLSFWPSSSAVSTPATIPETTASTSGYQGTPLLSLATEEASSSRMQQQESNAGSLSTLVSTSISTASTTSATPVNIKTINTLHIATTNLPSNQDMAPLRHLSPPILQTIMATPTSPLIPSLPLSTSPPSDPDTFLPHSKPALTPLIPLTTAYPSPSSPSFASSLCTPNASRISSPEPSDSIPFPASRLTPAKLAHLLDQSQQESLRAGSRRPLILDLRPHPDFYPISIAHSININLPTLLMRRYRRGVAVTSFALESFITIPSDKDVYHQILDSWKSSVTESEEPHDVIVLDQDMKAGDEEHGRSATAAWTLLNVLERGGSQSDFDGVSTRMWFLEGGFDAFQSWDASEKFLVRAGGFQHRSSPCLKPCTSAQADQDVEMTLAVPGGSVSAPVSRRPSLAIDTTVAFAPKQKTPVRRESLFSLNTKALQRPTGLSRSQTVNLKPLAISTQPAASLSIHIPQTPSSAHPHQQQPSMTAAWLTVPSTIPAPALSPAMSMVSNCSMEIAHSASTDHTSSWSADSGSMNGSGHFLPSCANNNLGLNLNSKRSVSSLLTINSLHASASCASASILEEDDEELGQYGSRPMANQMFNDREDIYSHQNQRRHQKYQHHDGDSFQYASDYSYQSHQDPSDCIEENQDNEQEISCILPGFLYLGPEIVTNDQVEELDRLGVKRILNMATECEDVLVAHRPGMEYHKIGVYDNVEADVSAGLIQAVDIIAASKDSAIYVHCKAGKSRSVTATIAYLISHLQWPLNKAYQHVLTNRPCMCPNLGFVAELIEMEKHILGADHARGLQLHQLS
ncbi:hypothetical protein BG015_001694 [Linnemannia schmuckeri]|uniref:protein-tyrosine-phosphatase n=1 Tax=Linnemannia schmuckeri TaxID=64567 RepID=A0A9P5V6S2_9FUNG|nr:hypothetical protein BG015_001694 [Linnemannia schmuckeri]